MAFRLLVILVAALGVLITTDPFKLSPLAELPSFKAKAITPPIPRPGSLPFPRDHHNKLQQASRVRFLYDVMGPESLAFDSKGRGPYTGIADGRIMRWDGSGWTPFATLYPNGTEACKPQSPPAVNLALEHICGRPLGIHFMKHTGELYIADAYHGLRVVGPDGGEAKLVVGEAEGVPFHFTNDVEVSSDDVIYFTDSSSNYYRREFFLAAFSGDDSGRLLSYNPSNKEVKVLYKGMQFPNGLALSKDESFLVIAETTTSRLSRYWLTGQKAGTLETFVHLPGPPDNVRANEAGDFWVAIHCRRSLFVWAAFASPWVRHALLKLPISIKTMYGFFLGGEPHALIMRYDSSGNLLEVLEDQTGKLVKLISEVEERDGELWLGSVLMPYVAVYSR
ncbi:hypothetical protein GOP47_0019677 [Adiantum capillus-veneris]|uniref:Strictosidine synthase conserved region domain-containing protein n=1 Tax=Adiantum capillus-veneris TaxID=13818 RepID=A0A9D4UBZ1_ADICA|nr:hypothetical protein GOP47_0019677 [Adiantum capillus-veneris]